MKKSKITLFIMSGPKEGRTVEIEQNTVSLGRSPSSDIQIKDKFVSGTHLRVEKKGGKYHIKDLESTNGTYVGGIRIASGKRCEVKEGSPIVMGMSVVCLGEPCSEDAFSVLNTLNFPRAERRRTTTYDQDRPQTMKRNMALIIEVGMVLMHSFEIDEMLEKVLNAIFDLLGRIDRGVIIGVNPETGEMREVISRVRPRIVNHVKAYSQEVVAQVLRDQRPVVVSDSDAEENGELPETLKLLKIRSVMCIPLLSRFRIMGVIYVDSVTRPYGFRKEDLSLLTSLSAPLGMAMENAMQVSSRERAAGRLMEAPADLMPYTPAYRDGK
ncbi:MAG: FHA domain-containing protein [Proteobacteria bacterium]|nr:FHA domain-containing protein [Pseudomonadota bacterium]